MRGGWGALPRCLQTSVGCPDPSSCQHRCVGDPQCWLCLCPPNALPLPLPLHVSQPLPQPLALSWPLPLSGPWLLRELLERRVDRVRDRAYRP